jgi:hypothetical protein
VRSISSIKTYLIEFVDTSGVVHESFTYQTSTRQLAMKRAMQYKNYGLAWPGPGKWKTVITLIEKY